MPLIRLRAFAFLIFFGAARALVIDASRRHVMMMLPLRLFLATSVDGCRFFFHFPFRRHAASGFRFRLLLPARATFIAMPRRAAFDALADAADIERFRQILSIFCFASRRCRLLIFRCDEKLSFSSFSMRYADTAAASYAAAAIDAPR